MPAGRIKRISSSKLPPSEESECDLRWLERSTNRVEFGWGEMHARVECGIQSSEKYGRPSNPFPGGFCWGRASIT